MSSITALLNQALTGESRDLRRQAFVALLASEDWKLALAPEVISRQGYELDDGFIPDVETFNQAAPVIAANEEKIQRILEIVGSKFALELLGALAHHMGHDLADHLLAHLRTAQGERASVLLDTLFRADVSWVRLPPAKRVIRQQLRIADHSRQKLLASLANAGNLGSFLDELRDYPPLFAEEWNAMGRAKLHDADLINRALAVLGTSPEPLAYLLRLDPLPAGVEFRIMAAARPDWLVQGLEVAIVFGLHHRVLISLAELGIRCGGKPMAAATAWLHAAHLGKELLAKLATQMVREGKKMRLNNLIWVHQRRPPSANRAMEEGRQGRTPDPLDGAALIRQLRGDRLLDLVREILTKPYPSMMESILRPLCAVHREAAMEVVALCQNANLELAQRAKKARSWPDVLWPEEKPKDLEHV